MGEYPVRRVEMRVREADAGLPLFSLLVSRFSYHSPERWRALILGGALLLNGSPATEGSLLSEGDRITYLPPSSEEPPVDTRYGILWENGEVLAVNKSGNLPCHPAGRYFAHTLWGVLKRDGILPAPVFIHRLDRETSGLVLIAKTPGAARKWSLAFQNRSVQKEYTVWVEGEFPLELSARGWLHHDGTSAVRKKRAFTLAERGSLPPAPDSEWAETCFTRTRFCGGISRLTVSLGTGRTHQIRATLRSLGFPVVGDKLYGVDETLFLRFLEGKLTSGDRLSLRLPRQALHASRLTLAGLDLRAPLPPDLLSLP